MPRRRPALRFPFLRFSSVSPCLCGEQVVVTKLNSHPFPIKIAVSRSSEVPYMVRKTLLAAIVLLLPALSQAQVKMLRHPTYSKGKVAFSYLGDIWIANENGADAQRLTDNQARDQFPRFSPDGQWVALDRKSTRL